MSDKREGFIADVIAGLSGEVYMKKKLVCMFFVVPDFAPDFLVYFISGWFGFTLQLLQRVHHTKCEQCSPPKKTRG